MLSWLHSFSQLDSLKNLHADEQDYENAHRNNKHGTKDGIDGHNLIHRVQHFKWGEGVIENTSGSGSNMLVTIRFGGGTRKTLMAEYAKLKKVIQLGDS